MTSLKKPLIAIASAVALVTTTLIAAPANAAAVSVALANTSATGTGTTADPFVIDVPADNTVATSSTAADSEAVELTATVDSGAKTTITATGSVKLLQSLTGATSASGSQSLEITPLATTVTVYAFTTSTTAGTVTFSINGATTTVSVKGTAGGAYNLSVAGPSVANTGATAALKATVTDVFGNAVTTGTPITVSVQRGTATAFSYDSTDKVWKSSVSGNGTDGETSVYATITATAVTGLAKPAYEVTKRIVFSDLAGQVATLETKVAELEAKLALAEAKANGNKTKYNNLAKKWNKKFPKSKVALLK